MVMSNLDPGQIKRRRIISYYRELETVVANIENLAAQGELHAAAVIFLVTGNVTAESCYYKGTAKSKALYSLMLCLHKLQME